MSGFGDHIVHNIKNNPLYTFFLFIPVVILSFLFFAGVTVSASLQKGMDNMERRLGADIMLVPKGAKEDASNIILEGARGSFSFSRDIYDKVASVDGIDEISAQYFLKSLSADCCSSEVEIVFFDPKSDFLIGPWINKEFEHELTKDFIIVGYSVNDENGIIKLFDREYKIAAKMAKTGTNLDSSVYFTFDNIKTVIADAEKKGSFLTEDQRKDDIISSVFINIKKGVKTEDIIQNARKTAGDDFDVVYPRQLEESLSLNLLSISTTIRFVLAVTAVLLLFVLFIINVVIAGERKREVALLRMFGVSSKRVMSLLISEYALSGLLGALIGCLLGTLFIVPFGNYIGFRLEMPYLGPGIINIILTYVFIIFIVTSITVTSSLFPVIHISRMQPYTALRKEGE